LLREAVVAQLPGVVLIEPDPVSDGELALAHAPDYVLKVSEGTLTATEQRVIGLPWSTRMVERARRSVGATIGAARAALSEGLSVNLAGGTHHARKDCGAGYCVFNDVAVAARLMQAEAHRRGPCHLPVALIDLDVHQGDGSASILAGDESVFTLSLHGASNYPARKETSDLDIALADGCGDAEYLDALDYALDALAARFAPALVLYLAGADPHGSDRLGKLKLTVEGLAARDERVFAWCHQRRVACATVTAGGYNHDINTTVQIHLNTVRAAARWQSRWMAAHAKPIETRDLVK
jgi:acetoin utilization deacetylase AcuC-like enzyme